MTCMSFEMGDGEWVCVLIPTFTYLYKYTCKTNEENYIIYIFEIVS
jgi:hypothetical protein